eukprot:UN29291
MYAIDVKRSQVRARFFKETIISASQIKKLHPKMNITLMVDTILYEFISLEPGKYDHLFHNIVNFTALPSYNPEYREKKTYVSKPLGLMESPYDHTIHLDGDYFILKDTFLDNIFNLLYKFDMIMPVDWWGRFGDYTKGIPDLCICLVAWKKTQGVKNLLDSWLAENLKNDVNRGRDQENLWKVLQNYTHEVNLWSLPGEYQCPQFDSSNGTEPKWLEQPSSLYKGKGNKEHECQAYHSHSIIWEDIATDLTDGLGSTLDMSTVEYKRKHYDDYMKKKERDIMEANQGISCIDVHVGSSSVG